LVLAAVLVVTQALLAALEPPSAVAAPHRGDSGPAPVVVVLDASGSMNIADAPGPRIAAAKRAVVSLIRSLPRTARLGLLTYGTRTSSSAAAKAAGCRDITSLAPVGPVHKSQLINRVRGITARGYTPIGAALRRAAAALPKGTAGSIVLVSDGQDTCAPPNPCRVAHQLKHHDADLIVHTVGFRVGSGARQQLRCIADATGGTYRNADSGAGLVPVLRTQTDAGMRPYAVQGTPIDGTPTPTGAPRVSAGQYADTFRADRSSVTKYYTIDLAEHETFYVATTVVPAALRGGGTGDRLEVSAELRNPDGDRCVSSSREHDSVLAGKVDPVTALLSAEVGGPDWSQRCAGTGTFVLALTRDSASTTPTRSEIVVRFEPPVRVAGRPVSTVPPGASGPHPGSAAASCHGGASFDVAPLLSDGTCRDDLSTGETRYYRVHVGWGQRLAYTVIVHRVPSAPHGIGEVQSAVATPVRENLTLASTSNASRDFGGPVATVLTGATLVPVAYANRNSDRSDIRPYSLSGNYYLSVGMSYPVDARPFRTPVSVTVQVLGRSAAGPHYLPLPGTHPGSASPSPSPAATAPSTFPAGPASSGSVASASVSAQNADDADAGHWAAGAVGAAAAAICVVAGGAVVLLRRRRGRRAG
jgi:Ca-activated chloride channel family protein